MHFPRAQAAGFSIAVVVTALLAWALLGASRSASASPVAQAAVCQGPEKVSCQAKNERERRLRHLKFVNSQQKRPNVIVIETDDQNVTDMFVMSQTLSLLGARADEINTVALDDPDLFQYPIAYMIEVGWWSLRETEVAALRAYLLKGGFVIVDDFKIQGFGGGFGNGGYPWSAGPVPSLRPGVADIEPFPGASDLKMGSRCVTASVTPPIIRQ